MTLQNEREQELRIRWLEKQIMKADFDIEQERKRSRREVVTIVVSVVALAIAAFAAGHFVR